MLVGPTGGGKTTVRRILERALTLLPVEEFLLIEERDSISQVNILLNKMFLFFVQVLFYTSVTFFVLFTEVCFFTCQISC